MRVVALGTGQALDVGRRGDADVVFVHDRAAEERFVAEGFGGPRRHVMFNDFVIVGPAADPARIGGMRDTVERCAASPKRARPSSAAATARGTHAAELRLWQQAGIDPAGGRGQWYREVGQGMGAGAEHRRGAERLYPGRPRHLAVIPQPPGPAQSSSRAMRGCSTSTA